MHARAENNTRINGTSGDDILQYSDGEYILNGHGGDDFVELINGMRTSGVNGQDGNDTLIGSVPGYGQIHMRGGNGDDRLIMDLTNTSGRQGHHVYGGQGSDRFEFINANLSDYPSLGRIDDFDISRDSIWVDGEEIDLHNLTEGVRVVSYLGQQWLVINNRAIYALEGARQGGEEQHFSPLPPEGISALPTIAYQDTRNFVPVEHVDETSLNISQRPGSVFDFEGTDQDDWIYDYETTQRADSGAVINFADSEIHAGSGNDVIDAGKGNDSLWGEDGNDAIAGGTDDDVLYGGAGNDWLYGGTENDLLSGGFGSDVLYGGSGNDGLRGGLGDDILHGERGDDRASGGDGDDFIMGGDGNDRISGGFGDDTLSGDAGDDILADLFGSNMLSGGSGSDILYGGFGEDVLNGDSGDDHLFGGFGNDTLDGGSGNDKIHGGRGGDVMTGGAGEDEFIFHAPDVVLWARTVGTLEERYEQIDRIDDFEIGQDRIVFAADTALEDISDLSAWRVEIDSDTYFAVNIDNPARILVDVDDDVTYGEFMSEDNFVFL